jgi:DNA-binding NarL/FixJ family response regulator
VIPYFVLDFIDYQRNDDVCKSSEAQRIDALSVNFVAQNDMTLRIALVEDSPDIRNGLVALLNETDGLECVASFADGETAVAALLTTPVGLAADVILMDIQLPQMSGIDCIHALREQGMTTPIVMLTMFEDNDAVFQSLSAGAIGYLLKDTPSEKLVESLYVVYEGGSVMSPLIAHKVVQAFRAMSSTPKETDKLSHRETEILSFIADGKTDKQIAEQLYLSFQTVRKHVANIYKKLHICSRVEATAMYRRNYPAL